MSNDLDVREQRCLLTNVFTDLSDSTRIASMLEPEEFSALLDQLRWQFDRIVRKHGGTVIRLDGDGVFFVFGYPDSYRDNSRRAIEATLDLHDSISKLEHDHGASGIRLQLHSGIHSGIVLVRSGDESRGRFEILGEAANMSAKLCDIAGAGEIVISEQTLGGDRNRFNVSETRSATITGERQQLLYRRIIDRKTVSDAADFRIQYQKTPFVGRGDILNKLRQTVEAEDTDARPAIVLAEAGMGKSRLLHEFTRLMAPLGTHMHRGHCDAYLGSPSLQPVRHITLSLVNRHHGLSESDLMADVYPYLPGHRIIHDLANKRLVLSDDTINDLAELVRQLVQLSQAPLATLFIIDDWQWADKASEVLIRQLMARRTPGLRFVFAARARARIAADLGDTVPIALPPLALEDTRTALRDILPSLDPFKIEAMQSVSGGNPLFIEELCHALRSRTDTQLLSGEDAWLFNLINDRFSQLPDDLTAIVRAAAVIGLVVPRWLLDSLLPSPITAHQLAELEAADFLFAGDKPGTLQFKHGLTREAIHSLIILADRRALHGAVADALLHKAVVSDTSEDHGQLAYHYSKSGDPERAIQHGMKAGNLALRASALDKAQLYLSVAFDQAMRLNRVDERTIVIIQEYGQASIVDPSSEQVELLSRAVVFTSTSQNTRAQAWARYWLATLHYGLGEPRRSIGLFFEARKAAIASQQTKLISQIDASFGQAYIAVGAPDLAYQYLDRAIATKREKRSGRRPSAALAYALSSKGFGLADQGHFTKASEAFDDARQLMGGAPHQVMMSILAHEAASILWRGDFEEAIRLSSQVISMATSMRSRYHFAMSSAMREAARFYQTRSRGSIVALEETVQWMTAEGSQQYASLNFGHLADAFAQVGDWDKVRHYGALALARARKGDPFGICISYRALAIASHAANRPVHAQRYIRLAHAAAARRASQREDRLTGFLEAALLGLPRGAMAPPEDNALIAPERFYTF